MPNKNLEEINLRNNNISDIEFLKDFNDPKLKKKIRFIFHKIFKSKIIMINWVKMNLQFKKKLGFFKWRNYFT